MLQWMWGCRHFFEILFSFPFCTYPEVASLDPVAVLCLIFWGNAVLFSVVTTQFTFPRRVHKALFSLHPHRRSSPRLVGSTLPVVRWRCCSDVCFPGDSGLSTCLCASWPSYVIFGKICSSAQFLIRFFLNYWIVWVLHILGIYPILDICLQVFCFYSIGDFLFCCLLLLLCRNF